jgi:hypothetical protein
MWRSPGKGQTVIDSLQPVGDGQAEARSPVYKILSKEIDGGRAARTRRTPPNDSPIYLERGASRLLDLQMRE